MQEQNDKVVENQQFEPKFVKEDRGTISGAVIGIASALAAQRIAEAETIRNKAKRIERDAQIIASTLLESVLPETNQAIADYMTSYVNDKAHSDMELCHVISSLYADEATSLNAKRVLAVEQIIDEDPHGITPLCAVLAKGQEFVDVMDAWLDNDYEHKRMAAKQTASTDLQTLYNEARESLIAHNIIDKNGNITDAYCEDVKKRAGLTPAPVEDVNEEKASKHEDDMKKRSRLQDVVPAIEPDDLGETVAIDVSEQMTQVIPPVTTEPEQNDIPAPYDDGDMDNEDATKFIIPGFAGIGTDDPYLDEINAREEAKEEAAELLVDDLADDEPFVTEQDPEAEISDTDNTIVADPLDEIDDDTLSPSITGDLGEAASAIAEIVEETHSTEALDTELVKEAILETVAEADDELVEALASVEDKPAIEEITELVASAAIAEAHIDEATDDELEDIEIVTSDEVEHTDDSSKAAMFTESFMAVGAEDEDVDEEE